MKYLPSHFYDFAKDNHWTQGEMTAYISVNYLDIATYGLLVLLAVRNIWVILYK